MAKIIKIKAEKVNEIKEAKIINILTKEAFEEKRIPNSSNYCIYETIFLDEINKKFDKKDIIIVYGNSNETEESKVASIKLFENGFENIYNFEGGIKEWIKKGFEIESETKKNNQNLNGKYQINTEESKIEWSGRNFGSKHHGDINIKNGIININENKIEGKSIIDMKTIKNFDLKEKTYNQMLINHLKSSDFFDVENYDETIIEFIKSENIETYNKSKPNYKIRAKLTIKNITEEIEFEANIQKTENEFIMNAHFDIDRTRWNIKYGSEKFFAKLGMHIVSDIISIDIIIKAKK